MQRSKYFFHIVGTIIAGIAAGLFAAYFDDQGEINLELGMFGVGIVIAGILFYFIMKRDNDQFGKIE